MNESHVIGAIAQLRINEKTFADQRERQFRELETGMLGILSKNKEKNDDMVQHNLVNTAIPDIKSPLMLLGEFASSVVTTTSGVLALTNYSRLFMQEGANWNLVKATETNFYPLSKSEEMIVRAAVEQLPARRPNLDIVSILALISSRSTAPTITKELETWRDTQLLELAKKEKELIEKSAKLEHLMRSMAAREIDMSKREDALVASSSTTVEIVEDAEETEEAENDELETARQLLESAQEETAQVVSTEMHSNNSKKNRKRLANKGGRK